jgi:hypothetical protein
MTTAAMSVADAELYLERECGLVPVLTEALAELCLARPADPFLWLAEYLVTHNPNTSAKAEGFLQSVPPFLICPLVPSRLLR